MTDLALPRAQPHFSPSAGAAGAAATPAVRQSGTSPTAREKATETQRLGLALGIRGTAISVWIDGFSFSALVGSKIFGKIPRISIETARILRRIFHFGWDFY